MAWQWWDSFDKRFCGKWIGDCPHYGEVFISITFDEKEGAQVNFSIGTAIFNHSALYVEYSYDSLYFFENDRVYRLEFDLVMDESGDKIKCRLIQRKHNEDREIEFIRLTEEEEKKYQPLVKLKDSSRIEILREYAEYGDIKTDAGFEYKFDERENVLDIIEKYGLDELVKGKNDAETAIALMGWLCGLYRHGNPSGSPENATPQAVLVHAEKNGNKINCRHLSLVLSQLIRAYNIKAFHITCMPYEEPFDDCHVVVCVYCESLGKYIMLDPSGNLYLKNIKGEIISAEELRDTLIAGEEVFVNEDNNGWQSLEDYCNYMSKNLIRICRSPINSYGHDARRSEGAVTLVPAKYMDNEAKNIQETGRAGYITSRESFWR